MPYIDGGSGFDLAIRARAFVEMSVDWETAENMANCPLWECDLIAQGNQDGWSGVRPPTEMMRELAGTRDEFGDVLMTHGVESQPSQLATPPETRAPTPRLSITVPPRLRSYIPPANYGTVQTSAIYRSGFPQDKSIDFMESLNLKTILTLVETAPCPAYSTYITASSIDHHLIPVAANKDGLVKTVPETLYQALALALDPRHHPLYIHCNQGRHRTGCVIACLRKVQGWPLKEVLDEYRTYANPKARPGDVELITGFDVDGYFAWEEKNGLQPQTEDEEECVEDEEWSVDSMMMMDPVMLGEPMMVEGVGGSLVSI